MVLGQVVQRLGIVGMIPAQRLFADAKSFLPQPDALMFVDPKTVNKRILRNLPYAHRGYVFKSKELQKYFRQLWWYMPDPQWQPSTDDFKANEMKLIN